MSGRNAGGLLAFAGPCKQGRHDQIDDAGTAQNQIMHFSQCATLLMLSCVRTCSAVAT